VIHVGVRFPHLVGAGAVLALVGGLALGPAHGFPIPVGGEFHVNSHTTDYQILPEVCGNDDGTFVVTWSSNYQDGYGWGVFGQRFDSNGSALGTEFQVNSTSPGYQSKPDSCCTDDGFIVVWSFQSDGDVSASIAGECGETAFTAADCKFNGAANKLSCKQ